MSAPPSTTISYAPDDDQAADEAINHAVRSHHIGVWRQLRSPRYLEQSIRVLRGILDKIDADKDMAAAAMKAHRSEFAAGRMDAETWAERSAANRDWRGRCKQMEANVRRYLRMLCADARDHQQRHTEELLDTVRVLAGALRAHRQAATDSGMEPEPADVALWARLSLLRVRADVAARPVAIGELAAGPESEQDVRLCATMNSLTAVELLLDMAGDATIVDRSEFTRRFAEGATYLRANPDTADGRATEALGGLLREWEKAGVTRRTVIDGRPCVALIDVDRLRRLGRQSG